MSTTYVNAKDLEVIRPHRTYYRTPVKARALRPYAPRHHVARAGVSANAKGIIEALAILVMGVVAIAAFAYMVAPTGYNI